MVFQFLIKFDYDLVNNEHQILLKKGSKKNDLKHKIDVFLYLLDEVF